MSKECRYFVQHAWKEDMCANCFKSREEHQKMNVSSGFINVKVNTVKIQSILKYNENKDQLDGRKKNVIFPEVLSEVIGYGGDDFDGESFESIDEDSCQFILDDSIIDNEEERQLNNLTRANTNFNRITANLNGESNASSTKDLSNLMLGNVRKDANGKKTTLLVSVTPFGSDNSSFQSRTVKQNKPTTDQNAETNSKNIVNKSSLFSRLNHETVNSSFEKEKPQIPLMKIVDMPLIESNNSNKISNSTILDKRKVDVEINDVPEIDKNIVNVNEELNNQDEDLTIPDMEDRTVEGEPSSLAGFDDEKFMKNSREDAGVPDGKADEDEISEPASLASLVDQIFEEASVPPVIKIPTNSFLHSKILNSEPYKVSLNNVNNSVLSASCDDSHQKEELKEDAKVESVSECPPIRRRMAPKPPEIPKRSLESEDESNVYTRKVGNVKLESPVVREKEKRERATLCNSKMKKTEKISINNNDKNISLSETNLVTYTNPSTVFHNDYLDDSKIKCKSRFSLKKLLRIGGLKKDIILPTNCSDNVSEIPQPKARPEIIHPLELDGAAVQVLRHDKLINDNELIISNEQLKTTESSQTSINLGRPPLPPKHPQLKKPDTETKQSNVDNLSWKSSNSMGDMISANLGVCHGNHAM